ncbi:MAG: alpha/beta hydrolase-fold protein [Chitinophagaceae bacterium]
MTDSLYLAGSFNGWNPSDEKFRFQPGDSGSFEIKFNLPAGKYEYKITRGSWDRAECAKGGGRFPNRQLIVDGDREVIIDIEEWQDRLPPVPRKSTAGKQVQILDTAFNIPQLNRTRRVWVYLPPGYERSGKHYPVLYLHDGQNIFEDTSSYAGEWGVDEFMDTMSSSPSIVVAIDHGGITRFSEYSPYDLERFGQGQGELYTDFIVHTLRPYINKRFRTRRSRKNTFIAGSSMGGLISMYALLKFPRVFGGAGVFSPSFWAAPRLFEYMDQEGHRVKSRIYFYAGQQEGETMVPLTLKALGEMSRVSRSVMKAVIRQEGSHNEARWREEFPLFYNWIMSEKKFKTRK